GERRGEGFLDEDMGAGGRDLPHPLAVLRGGGAKDDDVGLRLFQAGAVIGEAALARDAEFADGILQARGLRVGDADDLDLRMRAGEAEEVAHVEMVEIDSGESVAV